MAEEKLGFESIVCATTKLDVICRRLPTCAIRHKVMKFKAPPLRATVAIPSDESTPTAVSGPNLSPDFGRDVACAAGRAAISGHSTTGAPTRLVGSSKFLPFEIFEKG